MAMERVIRNEPVSVITCDLEGKILTYNEAAVQIFGYQPEEVIGRERVSVFSDGMTVLGHVPRWLGESVAHGEFETDTAFRGKNGKLVAAHIRITPTRKDGKHIGYCGVTRLIDGVDPKTLVPKPSLGTRLMRWMVVTRAPFLTATLVPVFLGAAVAYYETGVFHGLLFGLTLLAAILVHLGTNMANDYFDWKSGTDDANVDYVVPFSGGSRSIQMGLIQPRFLYRLAVTCFVVGGLIGLYLASARSWAILWIGVIGLFLAYFYTAPPVRLCARRGLGELAVGLGFGPLIVLGTYYVQSGVFSATAAWASIPVGLLIAAVLYINEFPDYEGDRATGKNHLVVVLGKRRATYGYFALLIVAYGIIVVGSVVGLFPRWGLLAVLGGFLAWQAARVTMRHFADRELLPAHGKTIGAHLVTGLLFSAAFVIDKLFEHRDVLRTLAH
jgi:1,4-dihydroxy-2-naphthoate polyprenyltransferase